MLLSDKLKELREEMKLPQRKVAAVLDIDTATYSKIENGKYMPNRDFILRLATFFECDSGQLIKLWLADRVVAIIKDEQVSHEAMQLAYNIIKDQALGNQVDVKV